MQGAAGTSANNPDKPARKCSRCGAPMGIRKLELSDSEAITRYQCGKCNKVEVERRRIA
jgi:hypothetical protein